MDTLLDLYAGVERTNIPKKITECLFRLFLMQIKTMDDMIEERLRKIENEELLRIFPINTVIGT